MENHRLNCKICDKGEFKPFLADVEGLDYRKYNFFRCDNCGFIGVYPIPDQLYINNYYIDNYKGLVKKNISNFNVLVSNRAAIEDCYKKLEYVEKRANLQDKEILDVGCGNGFFLYAAKNKGYKATGIDIDKEAISFGNKFLGVNIINSNINSFDSLESLYNNKFDLVTFWMVLEHLRKPFNTVNSVTKLIKEGGYLAGSVPNANGIGVKIQGLRKWYLTVPPEHLNYFNKKSLHTLLRRSGLEPIFIGTVPLYAMPYIVFGIRNKLIKIARKSKYKVVKNILLFTHRIFTLSKRYLFYYPLNKLIILFKVEGNSFLFIAKKVKL